jgi:hypothetical protein
VNTTDDEQVDDLPPPSKEEAKVSTGQISQSNSSNNGINSIVKGEFSFIKQ